MKLRILSLLTAALLLAGCNRVVSIPPAPSELDLISSQVKIYVGTPWTNVVSHVGSDYTSVYSALKNRYGLHYKILNHDVIFILDNDGRVESFQIGLGDFSSF